jgi:hypothetical protein
MEAAGLLSTAAATAMLDRRAWARALMAGAPEGVEEAWAPTGPRRSSSGGGRG